MEGNNICNVWGIVIMLVILGTASDGAAQHAVIALDEVKLYSLPLVDDSPVAVLSKGDTVRIIGQRGEWVKVEYAKERKGWMRVAVQRNEPAQEVVDTEITAAESSTNGHTNGHSQAPDIDRRRPSAPTDEYRRFGYSFGLGLLQSDFIYNWKFVFHKTRRLALEGSFKHALGKAADSYFLMANLSYLLKENDDLLPYLTGGMGVVNTVPDRSIDSDGVSHMAVNYGVGARKLFKNKMAVMVSATMYTVFVGKGMSHFREITVGFLVGKFWE